MLTSKEIKEIKESLKNSKNPLFFIDDDPDGICSYLILKKHINKGKVVLVKSTPILTEQYLRKVEERSPDHIFVLDVPIITQEFIDQAHTKITHIDHHPIIKRNNLNYYNPLKNNPEDNTSTSALCYQITNENLWLATIGSISDFQIPEYLDEFNKKYPNIIDIKSTNPGDFKFKTKLKELIRLFELILKNPTNEIYRCLSILEKIESPYELLNKETSRAKYLFKKIQNKEKEYLTLLEKSKKTKVEDNLLLFKYPSTKNSFTTELSNELIHISEAKVVIVAREKDKKIKMSIRSKKINLKPILDKSMKSFKSTYGGHDYACGATLESENFNEFIDRFKNLIKHK